jgi:hypothetical protein
MGPVLHGISGNGIREDRDCARSAPATVFMDAPPQAAGRVTRLTPMCTNCGASDFVWANDLKTGGLGGGSLSLRSRGELSLGTRICRACGHADLFLKDPAILKMPHTWKPGEFTPITPRPAAPPPHHASHSETIPPAEPVPSLVPPTLPEPPFASAPPAPPPPARYSPAPSEEPPAPSSPPAVPESPPPMAAPPPPPPEEGGRKQGRRRGSRTKSSDETPPPPPPP